MEMGLRHETGKKGPVKEKGKGMVGGKKGKCGIK
jgi:hypothetical protein